MYLYVQDSIEKILIKKTFLQMIDSDILPLRLWEMAETKTFTIPPCMCMCGCVYVHVCVWGGDTLWEKTVLIAF